MRKLLLALAAMTLPSAAFAADYFRGPMYDETPAERIQNWSGTYFGGHGGFTQGRLRSYDSIVVSDPLGNNSPVTVPLARASGSDASYGGFIGYNAQWDDVVLGFEFNYSRLGSKSQTSVYSMLSSWTFDPNVGPEVARFDGIAKSRVSDLFGFRARAGYAWGWMMPYATAGVVVARGETSATATVNGVPVFATGPGGGAFESKSATPFGFSVGLGVDMAITSNIFARTEIEYVGLRESKGVGGQFTTYRAGLGYRF